MAEPGIVTPEAVVLSFETAGVGSRLIAQVIDLSIQIGAGLLIAGGAALLGATSIGLAGVYFGLFLVAFGYPIAMETLWRGRTVGKAAMGLRVVTVEGAPIRFRHALVRGALGLLDFWATGGGAAVLCILATRRNQRLGDLVAGTLVIRERRASQALSAVTFWVPPGWEPYAATLDVSGVSAADYQAIRAFLVRAPTLDPWTRDRLAREIATAVLPRLRHQPPAGVSPEVFLVCVAALYQARQRRVPPPATSAPAPGPTAAPPTSASAPGPTAAPPTQPQPLPQAQAQPAMSPLPQTPAASPSDAPWPASGGFRPPD